MRQIFVILMLLLSAAAQAQDAATLKKAVAAFDKALTGKDSAVLKTLLSEKVTYGHSNGWVQSKRQVIEDLYNGKLTYTAISSAEEMVILEGTTASVRNVSDIEVVLDGKTIRLKLKVLQVWVWKNRRWELFARQSTKI